MISRIAYRHIASPPRREEKPAPAAERNGGKASSPTELVAKVVLGAMLVFIALTLAALAPMTIAVLAALAGVSGLLALVGRYRYAGPRARRVTGRRWSRALGGWGTLAVSSVVLLVLSLVAPDGYDVLFATLGVAGMVAVRLGSRPIPARSGGSTTAARHRSMEPHAHAVG